MKKNVMMRLASGLLIAVLLTTCAIAGTFAKYTTSVSSQDSARVAKWGFEQTSIDITDLFKNAYVYQTDPSNNSVYSETSDVIAPGTANSSSFKFVYDVTNNGATAPEVAYRFTVSTEGSTCHADIIANDNIQWKLDDGAWGTWDALLTSIKGLSGDDTDGSQDYAPGVLPPKFAAADNEHTIHWKWIFETTDEADVKDTALGNADVLAGVTIKITITATQID